MYTISDILMDIDRGCLVKNMADMQVKGKAGKYYDNIKIFQYGTDSSYKINQ